MFIDHAYLFGCMAWWVRTRVLTVASGVLQVDMTPLQWLGDERFSRDSIAQHPRLWTGGL
jgi:hypothetical protein